MVQEACIERSGRLPPENGPASQDGAAEKRTKKMGADERAGPEVCGKGRRSLRLVWLDIMVKMVRKGGKSPSLLPVLTTDSLPGIRYSRNDLVVLTQCSGRRAAIQNLHRQAGFPA